MRETIQINFFKGTQDNPELILSEKEWDFSMRPQEGEAVILKNDLFDINSIETILDDHSLYINAFVR